MPTRHLLRSYLATVSFGLLLISGTPVLCQSTDQDYTGKDLTGKDLMLLTPAGGQTPVRVLSSDPEGVRVELDGRTYDIHIQTDNRAATAELHDASGKTVARTERGRDSITLTDTRGNSVVSRGATMPVFPTSRLFDSSVLTLLNAENLTLLRGQSIPLQPGLTLATPTIGDNLCCNKDPPISNCFLPNKDGTCSGGQVIHACPNNGPVCEINSTWNCC